MKNYRETLRLFNNELKTYEIVNACSVSKKTVIKDKNEPQNWKSTNCSMTI